MMGTAIQENKAGPVHRLLLRACKRITLEHWSAAFHKDAVVTSKPPSTVQQSTANVNGRPRAKQEARKARYQRATVTHTISGSPRPKLRGARTYLDNRREDVREYARIAWEVVLALPCLFRSGCHVERATCSRL